MPEMEIPFKQLWEWQFALFVLYFAFRRIMDMYSKAVIMDYFNQQEVMASHSQEHTGQQYLFR